MATFLVRETLGYEEFAESLLRLWEEKNGVSQSEVNFGLPPIQDSSWDWWYENYMMMMNLILTNMATLANLLVILWPVLVKSKRQLRMCLHLMVLLEPVRAPLQVMVNLRDELLP